MTECYGTDLINYTIWKNISDQDDRVDDSSASEGSRDWFSERVTWHRQMVACCLSNQTSE